MDRLTPAKRPEGKPIGYQRWTQLSFLHWRLPAEAIQERLPAGLTVDTWEGDAWLGLVPFQMSGVRPRWFPSVPFVSTFAETNIRTYVHHNGDHPGVYFFSLEAAKGLPVRIARWKWHLPYHKATMSIVPVSNHLENVQTGRTVEYQSTRLWPGTDQAMTKLSVKVGEPLQFDHSDSSQPEDSAVPGTLEHFLAERYYLYADTPGGTMFRGQVFHRPYPLRQAELISCEETLTASAGFPDLEFPCHTLFSSGVQVDIFPLKIVE